MMIAVSPDESSKAGKDRARRFIALYLSMFPNIAKETGLPQDLLAAARAAFQSEGLEAAASFIGDDVVDALSAAGTPDECRARLDDYRRAGITLPVVIPLEGAFDLTIETLGENAPPGQS